MKNNKIKRTFVVLGAVATLAGLAGCANDTSLERAGYLSDNLTQICNEQLSDSRADYSVNNFEIIGADVDKSSFDFDVNFNGVASLSNDSVAYTSIVYEVPSTYFDGLSKRSKSDSVYDVFDRVVSELDPISVNISPVSSLSTINNAFIKNEPSAFEKYNIVDGLLYNLGIPEFNDEEKSVNFDTKTLVELKSSKLESGFGLGIGFNGGVGLGVGIFKVSKQGTFTIGDNYSFVVDENTYNAMKNDISLVYDYCASAINEKDNGKISAERKSVTSVTYDNADLLNNLDINGLENSVLNKE